MVTKSKAKTRVQEPGVQNQIQQQQVAYVAPPPQSKFELLFDNLTSELANLSTEVEAMHETLRPYLPMSEFDDSCSVEGGEPAAYSTSLDPSPIERNMTRALEEVNRLSYRLAYIRGQVTV